MSVLTVKYEIFVLGSLTSHRMVQYAVDVSIFETYHVYRSLLRMQIKQGEEMDSVLLWNFSDFASTAVMSLLCCTLQCAPMYKAL